MVHADTQNRTEIGGWQSIYVNRSTSTPWQGAKTVQSLKIEKIAGTNGILQLRSWASKTTLSHAHYWTVFEPFFLEANVLWLNITNSQFLHQNLTHTNVCLLQAIHQHTLMKGMQKEKVANQSEEVKKCLFAMTRVQFWQQRLFGSRIFLFICC